jgi:hypothetical protein
LELGAKTNRRRCKFHSHPYIPHRQQQSEHGGGPSRNQEKFAPPGKGTGWDNSEQIDRYLGGTLGEQRRRETMKKEVNHFSLTDGTYR